MSTAETVVFKDACHHTAYRKQQNCSGDRLPLLQAKTLRPVALKLGDKVLVKVWTNTTVKDLLEQLDRACKDGRI